MDDIKYKFPKNFYWGAATSAHQVEGNNFNDWSRWEEATASSKSQMARKKTWPDYILNHYPNPLQDENYISGRACDHYNRFREDFDIAKSLGHNAHRFSIEWSRIEIEEGKFDMESLRHYEEVIKALRERNIEPFVTLWHWTLPRWLADKGGVKNDKFPEYFERYTEKVVRWFIDTKTDVSIWITINEPLVNAKISYLEGRWPPQEKNIFSYIRVTRNLIRAHKKAFRRIKIMQPDAEVGIAHNMSFFEVEKNNFINRVLKRVGEWRKNFLFLNAIAGHQDFIGFNYYSHYNVNFGFRKVRTEKTSDMGWSLYPKGIYRMLKELQERYDKPIFITENGLADSLDLNREWFIKEHLQWVVRAIEEGVNVRGYLHWSLLDNFEWSDGFWPRFGLVEVEYKTMERKIRPSAYEYAKIAQNNGF